MKKSYKFKDDSISEKEFYLRLDKVLKEDTKTIVQFCDNFSAAYHGNREFFKENIDSINVYNDALSYMFGQIANKFYDSGEIDKSKPFFVLSLTILEYFSEIIDLVFVIYSKFKRLDPDFVLMCCDLESWEPSNGYLEPKDTISKYNEIEVEFPGIWGQLKGEIQEGDHYRMIVKFIKKRLMNMSSNVIIAEENPTPPDGDLANLFEACAKEFSEDKTFVKKLFEAANNKFPDAKKETLQGSEISDGNGDFLEVATQNYHAAIDNESPGFIIFAAWIAIAKILRNEKELNDIVTFRKARELFGRVLNNPETYNLDANSAIQANNAGINYANACFKSSGDYSFRSFIKGLGVAGLGNILESEEIGDLVLGLLLLYVSVKENEPANISGKYMKDIEDICKLQLNAEAIYDETLDIALTLWAQF